MKFKAMYYYGWYKAYLNKIEIEMYKLHCAICDLKN